MNDRFVLVRSDNAFGGHLDEIIDTETGIHYLGGWNIGITPRLNADGTIMTENNKNYYRRGT